MLCGAEALGGPWHLLIGVIAIGRGGLREALLQLLGSSLLGRQQPMGLLLQSIAWS